MALPNKPWTHRAVDGHLCALKTCGLGRIITADQAAVILTTPIKLLSEPGSFRNRDSLLVDWRADKADPRTFFHATCWKDTREAAKCTRCTQLHAWGVACAPARKRRRGEDEGGPAAAAPVLAMHADERRLLTAEDEETDTAVHETAETFSTATETDDQARKFADMLRESDYTVAFTGAGISVSSGIPDYRGTAGVDTTQGLVGTGGHRGESAQNDEEEDVEAMSEEEFYIHKSKDYLRLVPSYSHRALVALGRGGKLQYTITQNCDGLHSRAGTPADALAELHGNVFVEHCEVCYREYHRPYCVDMFSTDCREEDWYHRCRFCGCGHYTGRKCDGPAKQGSGQCGGKLRDTIVNFRDRLHTRVLGGIERAQKECRRADLILCLGSSLTVRPANTLPALISKNGHIVVVNLQETMHDAACSLRVYYPIDAFMERVMHHLGMAVPTLPPA